MSIETWLIGAGAGAFLVALVFEVWTDVIFVRLMLDSLKERRHRREMEERAIEADLIRAKQSTTNDPDRGPAPDEPKPPTPGPSPATAWTASPR